MPDRVLLELTELTYEAALEAELWPLVLARCARAFSAPSMVLLGLDRRTGRVLFDLGHGLPEASRSEVLPSLLAFARGHESAVNGLPVVLAYDAFNDGRAAEDPPTAIQPPAEDHYLAAMLDVGFGHAVLVAVHRPAAPANEGTPPGQFARLAPHLERALQVSHRLAALGTHSAAADETIQRLPVGVFMLDESAEVRLVNRAAHELLDDNDGLYITEGVLRVDGAQADAKLHELIDSALAPTANRAGGALVVHRKPPRRPLSVVVAPVHAEPTLFFRDARMLAVFVADPDRRHTPPREFLQSIYGLTHTESRLACYLVSGDTLEEAAEKLGTKRGTARVHLERIFRKTGTNRQADLVRVLLTSPAVLKQ